MFAPAPRRFSPCVSSPSRSSSVVRLVTQAKRRSSRGSGPQPPHLEALEPRWLPSIFNVTNTNDSGPGSLRQAILDANAVGGGRTLYIANAGNNTLTAVDPLGNASTFA